MIAIFAALLVFTFAVISIYLSSIEITFFTKDWRVVWVHRSVQGLTFHQLSERTPFDYERSILWEILYSEKRDKYKLKVTTKSPIPKEHPDYVMVIDKLNEFYEN